MGIIQFFKQLKKAIEQADDDECLIEFKKVRPNAELPQCMTRDAVGMDFFACLDYSIAIQPGEYRVIPFGLAYQIDPRYWLEICGRSSLEVKHGVFYVDDTARYGQLMEAFKNNRLFCVHDGVIESGYRGELSIMLYNAGRFPYTINPGDRIGQGIIHKRIRGRIRLVTKLSPSERGETGGFGSTGK